MKEYLVQYGQPLPISYTQALAVGVVNVSFVDVEYGEEIYAVGVVPASPGNYSIVLPGELNNCDRVAQITVNYVNAGSEAKVDKFYVSLRRPYATATELASELGLVISATPTEPNHITTEQLQQYERYAATRINAITLNHFNCKFNRRRFTGSGTDTIAYDENIVSVEKAWKSGELSYDGTLESYPDGLVYAPGDGGMSFVISYTDAADIIYNPYASAEFQRDTTYTLQFVSGYEATPEDIKQATTMLVNEFRCNDYGQRNHYVVKSENQFGKIEYAPNAYAGTGNVAIDQLLTPYMRLSVQVV